MNTNNDTDYNNHENNDNNDNNKNRIENVLVGLYNEFINNVNLNNIEFNYYDFFYVYNIYINMYESAFILQIFNEYNYFLNNYLQINIENNSPGAILEKNKIPKLIFDMLVILFFFEKKVF